ncbi:hypothetical protein JVU11DRAFT_954 [Chiua virens]|nr:hypothetical protein JVU11DRAFT_954 [Chiua virens]
MPSRGDLRWSALAILAAALLPAGPLAVVAQTTTAVCLSSFNWMDNSKTQNPCLVAAFLQGACNGGEFTVDALPLNTHYIGPSAGESNACQCSSVTYNTISACGLCQNRTIIGWSAWNTNCSTVYLGVFTSGVPSGTAVPQWAFQDVTTSNSFNVTLAQATGDNPESTASNPQSTATNAATSSTTSVSLTATPSASSTSSSASSASSNSDAGAIAGGVVGGVGGLALIAAVAVFYMKKKRSQIPPSAHINNLPSPGYPLPSGNNTDSNPFITQMTQPKFYDPSDPSTFPASLPPNTITTVSSQNTPGSNINYSNPSVRPGAAYSGVPEI